jgi:hypothetical protein
MLDKYKESFDLTKSRQFISICPAFDAHPELRTQIALMDNFRNEKLGHNCSLKLTEKQLENCNEIIFEFFMQLSSLQLPFYQDTLIEDVRDQFNRLCARAEILPVDSAMEHYIYKLLLKRDEDLHKKIMRAIKVDELMCGPDQMEARDAIGQYLTSEYCPNLPESTRPPLHPEEIDFLLKTWGIYPCSDNNNLTALNNFFDNFDKLCDRLFPTHTDLWANGYLMFGSHDIVEAHCRSLPFDPSIHKTVWIFRIGLGFLLHSKISLTRIDVTKQDFSPIDMPENMELLSQRDTPNNQRYSVRFVGPEPLWSTTVLELRSTSLQHWKFLFFHQKIRTAF